jgi:hypothetical protein
MKLIFHTSEGGSEILNSQSSVFLLYRYSVDVQIDKSVVNKDVLKDAAAKRKARTEVKSKFEERYCWKFT